MRRVLSVGVAILVAIAIAYFVLREDETFAEAVAPIEKLVAAGRVADARSELGVLRTRTDPAVADYCDGLLLVAEQKDAEAVEPLSRARAAKPLEWRVVNTLSAALSNSGNLADAGGVLEDYVVRQPDDERGLAAYAAHCILERSPRFDPSKSLAAIERIRSLPERVADDGDPTHVKDADLRRTRTKALLLTGRSADALLDARDFVQRHPEDAEGWYILGDAARLQPAPHADESLGGYRRAAQLVPGKRRYLEQLAMALLKFQGPRQETFDTVQALLAQWPADPALQVLHARALVRMDQLDDAHAEYRELQRRADTLPKEVHLAVLRNLGVLLCDWGAGGRPGDYMEEAWSLLQRYRQLGGVVDSDLETTWRQLEEAHAKRQERR